MFDTITATRAKTRRGTSMLVSILLHGAAIALAVAFTYVRAHMPKQEQAVDVVFRPPPPPPPPPPPAARKKTTPRQTPKIVPKAPTQTIVQPKELPKVDEKPPEDLPEQESEDEGVEGGVEGGVVGGVQGGVVGGTFGGSGTGPPVKRIEAENAVIKMQKISGPDIEYTPQAMEKEVQGTMVVKCLIGIDGSVHNCRVLQGLPFMDRVAVDTLHRQRYKPYMVGGQPVEVDLTFRIKLELPQ
jgi:protein TonB